MWKLCRVNFRSTITLGILTINAIVAQKDSVDMAKILRDLNVGVTVVDAEGKNEQRKILIIYAKRQRKNEIIKIIENTKINSVISVNDTKVVYGGYGIRK